MFVWPGGQLQLEKFYFFTIFLCFCLNALFKGVSQLAQLFLFLVYVFFFFFFYYALYSFVCPFDLLLSFIVILNTFHSELFTLKASNIFSISFNVAQNLHTNKTIGCNCHQLTIVLPMYICI